MIVIQKMGQGIILSIQVVNCVQNILLYVQCGKYNRVQFSIIQYICGRAKNILDGTGSFIFNIQYLYFSIFFCSISKCSEGFS